MAVSVIRPAPLNVVFLPNHLDQLIEPPQAEVLHQGHDGVIVDPVEMVAVNLANSGRAKPRPSRKLFLIYIFVSH
jgi:hypothetical protein